MGRWGANTPQHWAVMLVKLEAEKLRSFFIAFNIYRTLKWQFKNSSTIRANRQVIILLVWENKFSLRLFILSYECNRDVVENYAETLFVFPEMKMIIIVRLVFTPVHGKGGSLPCIPTPLTLTPWPDHKEHHFWIVVVTVTCNIIPGLPCPNIWSA